MSDAWLDKYRHWKKLTNSQSWSDFLDLGPYQQLTKRMSRYIDKGLNRSYDATRITSIDFKCWAHWSLCGANPAIVKQFGKEVLLGAEYYVKQLEKAARLALKKSRFDYIRESCEEQGHYVQLPFVTKIIPIHKDPGQLNQIINFAREEYDRKPNKFGATMPSWTTDFYNSFIALRNKADEDMDKQYMMFKLANDIKKGETK